MTDNDADLRGFAAERMSINSEFRAHSVTLTAVFNSSLKADCKSNFTYIQARFDRSYFHFLIFLDFNRYCHFQ